MANTSISPKYFWDEMTRAELEAVYKSIDKRSKEEWERIRMQTWLLNDMHVSKKYKKKYTPQYMLPLPWDKVEKEKAELSAGEKMAIIERLSKVKPTNKAHTF